MSVFGGETGGKVRSKAYSDAADSPRPEGRSHRSGGGHPLFRHIRNPVGQHPSSLAKLLISSVISKDSNQKNPLMQPPLLPFRKPHVVKIVIVKIVKIPLPNTPIPI